MIQVDVSNIWGALSLRDLLGLEQTIFHAHLDLPEACAPDRLIPSGELDRILTAAERIREESEVLLVIGGCPGIRGILELLQGSHRNVSRRNVDPQIFFAGDNLSTRAWYELVRLIEGKDFSLCVMGQTDTNQESAIAFRNLKWHLERRYGTDEARQRIYAITSPAGGTLYRMAQEEGWETFAVPENIDRYFEILSPAGLLPLAAAGIDIRTLVQGAQTAAEAFDLRSYENPVWLYTAARNLLGRMGRPIELLRSAEPGFVHMGHWMQQLFDGIGYSYPICTGLTGGLMTQPTPEDAERILETVLRFDPPEVKAVISTDVKDLDDLNRLGGSTLDQVEETALQRLVEAHIDLGLPVITIDCGQLNARTLGQLLWFFLLSRALTLHLPTACV